MASYQDIDTRLRVFEDMLTFVMTHVRMKAQFRTGLVGPDGRPQGQVFEGSLLDLYMHSKGVPAVNEAEGLIEEHNGTVDESAN
jgi:hypothetical protein